MRTIQTLIATTSLFCSSLNQLRALILAAETVVTAQADLAVLNAAFDSVSVTLVAFLGLIRAMHIADAKLYDIPLHEEAAPRQFAGRWRADVWNILGGGSGRAALVMVGSLQSTL
jgi:hypothetical protein